MDDNELWLQVKLEGMFLMDQKDLIHNDQFW